MIKRAKNNDITKVISFYFINIHKKLTSNKKERKIL